MNAREHVSEKIRRLENYLDDPFVENGEYTTLYGETLFSKLEEIRKSLDAIKEAAEEEPPRGSYSMTDPDLKEIEAYLHEATRERLYLKGILQELKDAVMLLNEEHKTLSEIFGTAKTGHEAPHDKETVARYIDFLQTREGKRRLIGESRGQEGERT